MLLEGTVSNVAQFGAFVDLGVHQDGLVHVSQLSQRFVRDAREAVKTGDIVKVRVLEVDLQLRRIGLSMKLDAASAGQGAEHRASKGSGPRHAPRRADQAPTAMASAFAQLQRRPQ
jgi:uncharacterized protein